MAEDLDAIGTHITTVLRNEPLGPLYRRITFGGGDLGSFEPLGPDQFVYLLLPPPGRRELTIDASFTWLGYDGMPPEEQPVGAYYTVRHHRPGRAELDVDVFLHDVPGPASGWARTAAPGDPAALWGPRTAFAPPAETEWWLLVADESGLPALAAILESLPSEAVVRAYVEVSDPADAPVLPELAGDSVVTWLARRDGEAGTTTLLADAVRDLDRPGGQPYVWGGGESRAMTSIRKHLRHEVGYERAWVSLTPYWRHQAHADDPDDPDE